ncbi:ATP-binding protein [Micromonospora sp. NPDC049497]|uniref:ATP-binding protein n=1 Tax=Micromonospora sp. NPDC049497 TaxID=3364273 RepID=UPI0037AFCAAB
MRLYVARNRFGTLPTTTAGVERAFTIFIAGVRLGTVAQMVPTLYPGMQSSPRPGLYLTTWLAAAVAAVAVGVASLVKGRAPGSGPVLADFALASVVMLVGPLVVGSEDRVGTWVGFQPGYALSVIITAIGPRSPVVPAVGLLCVMGSYVVHVSGATVQGPGFTTVVGNELTFVVYALVCRMLSTYMRRIARDADASRAVAAELARREEERRAQVLMHNGVAVMRLLTEPNLPDATRVRLLEHAEVELQRMRAYLSRQSSPDPTARSGDRPDPRRSQADAASLADAVRRTCNQFRDLPIELALDLGTGITMTPREIEVVTRALDSLLLNVREHAKAEMVVVHLDAEPEGSWILTVNDNGSGFDVPSTSQGIGLREVVVGELEREGYAVAVTSQVGEGTAVTITYAAPAVPRPAAPRARAAS